MPKKEKNCLSNPETVSPSESDCCTPLLNSESLISVFFHTILTFVPLRVLVMLLIKECYSAFSRVFFQAADIHSARIDAGA